MYSSEGYYKCNSEQKEIEVKVRLHHPTLSIFYVDQYQQSRRVGHPILDVGKVFWLAYGLPRPFTRDTKILNRIYKAGTPIVELLNLNKAWIDVETEKLMSKLLKLYMIGFLIPLMLMIYT